jgi:hypothetical protein
MIRYSYQQVIEQAANDNDLETRSSYTSTLDKIVCVVSQGAAQSSNVVSQPSLSYGYALRHYVVLPNSSNKYPVGNL